MEEVLSYLKPELVVLVPVLYFLGLALQRTRLDTRYIPLVLFCVGIVLSGLWVLATCRVDCVQQIALACFTSLTQGVLAAGAAVLAYRLHGKGKK